MTWRFPIYRANGDGTETLLDPAVPFSGVDAQIAINGGDDFKASIKPVVPRLHGLVEEDKTIVYALHNEQVFGAWPVDVAEAVGGELSVQGTGFLQRALKDVAYEGRYKKVKFEALDIARHIVSYAQGFPGGDLGIVADDLVSGVLMGEEEKHNEFTTGEGEDVEFDSGPYTLMWWKDDDLYKAFTDLADAVPFDWMMRHEIRDGVPSHQLMLGYPQIGRRRKDLRFRLGENIFEQPQVNSGEYFSTVIALGAGEGAKMKRAQVDVPRKGRLRKVKTISDKSWDTKKKCHRAANRAAKSQVESETSTVVIRDPSTFLHYYPGDEIRVHADEGWRDLDYWGRIKSIGVSPDDGDDLTIEFGGGDD